ncbi:MAG: hypothetical protein D6690_05880 [Nitrospirae bacterium]|nr:MAG: hypothetical protein D6690_05880 [Nitrospirota bacterium]
MKVILSKHGVPIRLTEERMAHIGRRHPEMQGQEDKILATVMEPDLIQEGDAGTLIALRHYASSPLTERFCAVVYREIFESDGFVLTAYFCTRYAVRRRIQWKR